MGAAGGGGRKFPEKHEKNRRRCWKGGGGYSFLACRRRLITDRASFSRRSTFSTTSRDFSNISAPSTFLPYITYKIICSSYLLPFWPSMATIFSLE